MTKKYYSAVVLMLFLWSYSGAEIGAGLDVGAGARGLSFAGNLTAVANDLSAVYWNPAALALLPVREFQVSFDGLRIYGTSGVTGQSVKIPSGAKMSDYRERIRLSGAGAMTAIPTVQGGLTLAFSFDRPFIFDDFTVYTYENSQHAIISSEGRRYGDLNRWSGAFGVQVSDKLSAGLTVSLVTGSEKAPILQEIRGKAAGEIIDYYDVEFSNKYLGYTLTGGLLYYPVDILKIGMRINAAMDIDVRETQSGEWIDNYGYSYNMSSTAKGRAYSAPSGAWGAGLVLPWLTAAIDFRVTMPYTFILPSENIPENVQARYFKCGAGVGLEVPLTVAPVVLRGGYSLDEYDLFPLIHKFEDEQIDWDFGSEFSADGLKHTLTAGAGVFTSGIGFELSYGYQTWGIIHRNESRQLKQRYSNHRVMTALIFRY